MSRLTSAQIIAHGHYLDPDFDPASLTVSQLLGVLGYHNIVYPTPYSKPKLIALFNAEIKPRTSKFKKERLKAEASIASDDGITDGHTGEPLTRKPPPVRRSSRRLSRAPSEDQDVSPVRADPPKRRRSSAQPTLGGPSRRVEPVEPAVVEESEPEEELPVRKVGRSKKTAQAAGEQGRRVSHTEDRDSGWEDNNVFQSGAESSSPARPRPKSVRKSVGPRKTRKSISAPPEIAPSPPPLQPKDEPLYSPPQSKFEPQLPPSVTRETRLLAPTLPQRTFVPQEHHKEEQDDTLDLVDTDFADDGPTEDYGDGALESGGEEEEEEEDHNAVISRRIAEGGDQLAVRKSSTEKVGAVGILTRIVFALLAVTAGGVGFNYKSESAQIGYCAAGGTNPTLEALRVERLAAEMCNRENQTLLPDGTPCPLPLPLPHPDSCTPCPEHGTCTQFSVVCDTGFLLRPHPILLPLYTVGAPDPVWRAIGNVTDGLPGLGSIGLPPRCVEDPKRKQKIGSLGKAIEKELGRTRGDRLCSQNGPKVFPDNEGGEARTWGLEVEALAQRMRTYIPPRDTVRSEQFPGLYTEAIQQLSEWGGITVGEDARSGKRYFALKTPHLNLRCTVLVKSRGIWEQWRNTVYALGLLIAATGWTRMQRARSAVEGQRVAGLVQTALDTLRTQERAYHTDPLSASAPYLSSLQLRDVVLAEEHSVPARARLWARVERIVEENANVRANLEEVGGGDEMRVWRWVGAPSPTKAIQ
ncbi:Man1-Src1p-C-terminal domain-containing protein [Mycena vitilis]|nr:Man1-Src1p-C-terminal domain-containing protein [Mycena vitilis]